MKSTDKNVAASVRQRLKNKMAETRRPFNELLQHYAMERFLYRLSKSRHAQQFILKGALMLQAWHAPRIRPTMDIDMLGKTQNDESHLAGIVQDILMVDVEDDGLQFFPETISTERIKEDADYEGVRILLKGKLDTAQIRIQIDVGFGDIVHPDPENIAYPTLLDFPAPKLLGYSRESTIAEKFEAMVSLGNLNSRMKDFYDIWLLAQQFEFDDAVLGEAIRKTFQHRDTSLERDIQAFSPEFAAIKQTQWKAFHNKLKQENLPENFEEILDIIRTFLNPVLETIADSQ